MPVRNRDSKLIGEISLRRFPNFGFLQRSRSTQDEGLRAAEFRPRKPVLLKLSNGLPKRSSRDGCVMLALIAAVGAPV